MAQVIRKYNIGGDLQPIEIYGEYYNPNKFLEDVSRQTENYIQENRLNQKDADQLRKETANRANLVTNGLATITDYGTISYKNGDYEGSSIAASIVLDAATKYKTSALSPQEYKIDPERMINERFGSIDSFKSLRKFNKDTGLYDTRAIEIAMADMLDDEANKIESNSEYRRKYSYNTGIKGDVNTGWETRANKTIADLRKLAAALRDNNISDDDIDLFSKFGIVIKNYINNEENGEARQAVLDKAEQNRIAAETKEKQEAAKKEEERKANNKFKYNFLPGQSSVMSYNGTDYTYDQFGQFIDNKEFQELLKNWESEYSKNFIYGQNGFHQYAADVSNLFTNIGDHTILKGWDNSSLNMDSGIYYIITPKFNENGETIGYVPTPVNINALDNGTYNATWNIGEDSFNYNLGYFNPNGSISNYITNEVDNVININGINFVKLPDGTYKHAGIIYKSVTGEIPQNFNDLQVVKKAQEGIKFVRVDTPKQRDNTVIVNTEKPKYYNTPKQSFNSKANEAQELLSGQELTDTDTWRLGSALVDLASVGLGFVPGANLASTGLGVASTIGELGSDVTDYLNNRQNAQSPLSFLGEAALNLGMDAVSLIPGGKSVKTASIVRNLAKFVPHIAGAIQTGIIAVNENERRAFGETLEKLASGRISSLHTKDYQNIAFIGRSILGLSKGYGDIKNHNTTKTSNTKSEKITATAEIDGKKYNISTTVDQSKSSRFGKNNKENKRENELRSVLKNDENIRNAVREDIKTKNPNTSDADIDKKVNEALESAKISNKNAEPIKSTVELTQEADVPKGWFNRWETFGSDAWFVRNNFPGARNYFGVSDVTPKNNTVKTDTPKTKINNEDTPKTQKQSSKWNAENVRQILTKYNGFTDEIKGLSDSKLLSRFPNREAINNHLKSIHTKKTNTSESNKIMSNDELVKILNTLPKEVRINPSYIKEIESKYNEFVNKTNNPLRATQLWVNRYLANDAARTAIAKQQLEHDVKSGKADDTKENLELYKRAVTDIQLQLYHRNNRYNKESKEKSQKEKRIIERTAKRLNKRKQTESDYYKLEEFINTVGPKTKAKAENNPKIRREILKMLREGKSTNQIRQAVSKMQQGGNIRKYQNSGQVKYNKDLENPDKFNLQNNQKVPTLLGSIPIAITKDITLNDIPDFVPYVGPTEEIRKNNLIDTPELKKAFPYSKFIDASKLAAVFTNANKQLEKLKKQRPVGLKSYNNSIGKILNPDYYGTIGVSQKTASSVLDQGNQIADNISDSRLKSAIMLDASKQAQNILNQGKLAYNQQFRQSSEQANAYVLAEEAKNRDIGDYNKKLNDNLHNVITTWETSAIANKIGNGLLPYLDQNYMSQSKLNALNSKLVSSNIQDLYNTYYDNILKEAKKWAEDKDKTFDSDSDLMEEYFKTHGEVKEGYESKIQKIKKQYLNDMYKIAYGLYGKEGTKLNYFHKSLLLNKKENMKSIRENQREFNKMYRALSLGTMSLIKKAMEE